MSGRSATRACAGSAVMPDSRCRYAATHRAQPGRCAHVTPHAVGHAPKDWGRRLCCTHSSRAQVPPPQCNLYLQLVCVVPLYFELAGFQHCSGRQGPAAVAITAGDKLHYCRASVPPPSVDRAPWACALSITLSFVASAQAGMLLSKSRSMTKPGMFSMPFAAQQAVAMASGKAAVV